MLQGNIHENTGLPTKDETVNDMKLIEYLKFGDEVYLCTIL